MGAHASAGNDGQPTGGASDTRAGLMIELITADQRDIRVNEFIDAMRDEIQPLPGLERQWCTRTRRWASWARAGHPSSGQ